MIEEKLSSRGINLSTRLLPIGSYSPVVISGNLAFVSGQIAIDHNKQPTEVKYKGKVGKEGSRALYD
jgi:enamine deaminase RidA (YjgF/YER057c/UK114 family)